MSNAVTVLNQQMPAFTPEQMHLITSTIARGATPDELKLFLYRCQNLGLDPLKPGQIYFIKYGSGPGTIVVGIEGFRARAARTSKLAGIKRGAIRNDKGELTGAFAEVYRSDWQECAREAVPLNEYNTGKGNWAKMPETMIKKVAEAAALRMAFPDELGGTYINEEMEQAQGPKVYPDQPGPDDAAAPADGIWRFPGGSLNGKNLKYRKFDELTPEEHRAFIESCEAYRKKVGKPLPDWWDEYLELAEPVIALAENEPGSEG